MATANYTNESSFQVPKPLPPVYVLPDDGELIFPGTILHDVMEVTRTLTASQKRKALTLIRMTASGEFDILQTKVWTDDQRRTFVESLPETEV